MSYDLRDGPAQPSILTRKRKGLSPKLIAVPANPVRSTRASRNEAHRNKMEWKRENRP